MSYIRTWLTDYKDHLLCDLLQFGFPIGLNGDQSIFRDVKSTDVWKLRNHKGALEFPEKMNDYLYKESKHKSIAGPFTENPFKEGIKISPLNSVLKRIRWNVELFYILVSKKVLLLMSS